MLDDDVLADAVSGPGEHKPSWAVIADRLSRAVDTHGMTALPATADALAAVRW
jgi:hypothetical protein